MEADFDSQAIGATNSPRRIVRRTADLGKMQRQAVVLVLWQRVQDRKLAAKVLFRA